MIARRAALLLGLLAQVSLALAEERIESFDVELTLGRDGMLEVVERIAVQAEGQQIRRGIFRDIPVRYQLPGGLVRKTPIARLSATRDGAPERVTRETQGSYLRFYLGSPEHYLTPGRYRYELRYRVDPQLIAHEGSDELYWNVTGTRWAFAIERASVRLQLPEGARIDRVVGYTGGDGERGQAYEILERDGNRLALRTTERLAPYQGLTVALDWPAGVVQRPGLGQRTLRLLFDNPGICLGFVLLLATLGYYWRTWQRVGRDPRKGLVIARFEPPAGLLPADVGYLWSRGRLDESLALGVCFTDWAIRGHLKLEDRPRAEGFILEAGSKPHDELRPGEVEPLRLLFPQGLQSQPVTLGGSYEPRLGEARSRLVERLKAEGAQWFSRNRGAWARGLVLALVGGLGSVLLSVTPGDELGMAIGGLMFGFGFGLPAALLLKLAFGEQRWGARLPLLFGGGMFLIGGSVGMGLLVSVCPWPALVLFIAFVLSVVLSFFWLEAPTLEGRRLLDEVEGYRDYLSLGEREALALAGQAPAMSIALYERHLPYAMALGVEEQWSERFSLALENGLVDADRREYRPDWYHSRHAFSSPALLSGALASGLASSTASAASPPASSSSSGGSSGGGSSGGGSGGGGGGGW